MDLTTILKYLPMMREKVQELQAMTKDLEEMAEKGEVVLHELREFTIVANRFLQKAEVFASTFDPKK